MTEIEQLRERNKELERLAAVTKAVRDSDFYPSNKSGILSVLEFDALYAKLFPPKPPEAKFKVGRFVRKSDPLCDSWAYRVNKAQYAAGWNYQLPDSQWYAESELSALSEEEATGK